MKTTLAFLATAFIAAPLAHAGANYSTASSSAGAATTTTLPKVKEPINERFYIDLAGGAVFLQDVNDFSFDTGWSVTGAFGVNLGNGLSVELESGYMTADVDSFDDESEFFLGKLSGDITVVPILANVKYTGPVTSLFNYYVGAGLGAIYSESTVGVGPFSVSDDEWDFAFQGIAGISIPMSEVLSFDLGYRFLATGFNSGELRSHSVEAGISFKF